MLAVTPVFRVTHEQRVRFAFGDTAPQPIGQKTHIQPVFKDLYGHRSHRQTLRTVASTDKHPVGEFVEILRNRPPVQTSTPTLHRPAQGCSGMSHAESQLCLFHRKEISRGQIFNRLKAEEPQKLGSCRVSDV